MTPQELRARIERFADDVIAFCRDTAADALLLPLLQQLQASATSGAANYRAACRAQTRAAFVAKLSIALEETDEATGWLDRIANRGSGRRDLIDRRRKEGDELSAILNASRRTATDRRRPPR